MTTTFLQLHFLTPYAPSNLNRDDLGRPKTALFGGAQRLRVSSQSLKRAWRSSDVFEDALNGRLGQRTRDLGAYVETELLSRGVAAETAEQQGERFAGLFAAPKTKKKKARETDESEGEGDATSSSEQVAFISASELSALHKLIATLGAGKTVDDDEILAVLTNGKATADIGLFGRMLTDLSDEKVKKLPPHQRTIAKAKRAALSVEAACQVAHAISIHKVAIEDDYFTAMEELNRSADRAGAAMVGTQEFASAVLYNYVCVDRGLLVDNLGGDEALVQKTLRALGDACLTVAPNGKQNSFASRSRAHFALVEKGPAQPRSLAAAFLRPVAGDDLLAQGVKALQETREKLDAIYGDAVPSASFDASAGTGTKKAVLDFFAEA